MDNKCDHTWIETVPPELCIDCGAVNEDTVLPWLRRVKAEAVREAVKSCQFVQYGDHKCFSDELMEYADKLERGDT